MIAAENIEECLNCGDELDRDSVGVVPNDSPYGVMGYFCDENCQVSASEAWVENRKKVMCSQFDGGSWSEAISRRGVSRSVAAQVYAALAQVAATRELKAVMTQHEPESPRKAME